jgi:hypothetical protein
MSVRVGQVTSEVDVAAAPGDAGAERTNGTPNDLHGSRLQLLALDRITSRTQDHDRDD